jgi:hypothetical protein
MNTAVRRKLDMAARVREFVRAHAATEPGYTPVVTRLDELLGQAQAILARQHQGNVASRGAIAQRNDLRRTIHAQLVHYLVAVGTVAAKGQADVAARFKLPDTNAPNMVYSTAVKALLAAGEGERDLLVKAGLSPTLFEELGKMVADFEAASEVAHTARRDHIGARIDLAVIANLLSEQVKLLDGITRYRFGKDVEMMAEWKAAKQLLGQSRPVDAPPAPEPSPAPQPTPAPSDVQKAA